jgi:hypothetical protein
MFTNHWLIFFHILFSGITEKRKSFWKSNKHDQISPGKAKAGPLKLLSGKRIIINQDHFFR